MIRPSGRLPNVQRLEGAGQLIPVLTFALSVSTVILVALILDTVPGDSPDLRMWLTSVPLFLLAAPATAIMVGGVAAASAELIDVQGAGSSEIDGLPSRRR